MGGGRLLVIAAGVALVVSACSGGAEQTIEPIEPILVGDVEILTDPSGTVASLSVETSVPVACAVIYGTDDSFGQLAVDSDMDGGAHENHGPLMTGLEPDTEYSYVLQGSDSDGTIYRSDIRTFRTPVAAESGLGTNIAPNGTVTGASSEFSQQFAASQAIDGDLGTEWSTAGDGDDLWIEIDLGQEAEISGLAFRTRQMTDGTAITDTFSVIIGGTTYGPFPTGTEPVAFDSPVIGRTLRIEAEQTTGGNTGATEIEIYSAS